MKKRIAVVAACLLLAALLGSCVHYVPREDREEETSASTTAAQTTAEATTAASTVATVTDAFPNETEDGQTKRY